jgi:uncharacterized protein
LKKYLANEGLDIKQFSLDFCNPMMNAACSGKINILKILLATGLDIDITNSYEETALMGAIESNQVKTVEFLINQGASLYLKNINKKKYLIMLLKILE